MKRSSFIKSIVGLVGGINKKILPLNTRAGDLLINKSGEVYFFTGKKLKSINNNNSDIDAEVGFCDRYDFFIMNLAFKEV